MHMFRIVTGFVMMDKSVIQEWRLLFLSTPFLPEALLAYGYCHHLCLCVCVYLCVCQLLLVRTITHHAFQLESPDLDEKMQNIFAPYCFGADWAWPSMSNLTSFYNSVYLHRFCVFEIFVRRAKTEFVELFPHRKWCRTHSDSFICTPTGSCHRPWNRQRTYLCETIGVLPALDSAIGSGFYKLLSVFAKSYSPHIPIFYITTSAITETTVKQRSSAFICSSLTLRSGVSEVLFLARLSTHASPSLFHILTSFVRTSPITLFTNRPCHGPWRGLGDSAL